MLQDRNKIDRWFGLIVVITIAGCAPNKGVINPQDPYEHFNRKVFAFNMAVDKAFFRPVAKTYDTILPWQLKKGVHNFFHNFGDVSSMANTILQLDFPQAIADLARVMINTTVGIGGLFDVATYLGVERRVEDFGLTLARWGSRNTPYLVLPFIGPSTMRDAIGLPIDYLILTPWIYIEPPALRNSIGGLYLIQRRAALLLGDKLVEQAFDPYVFVRDAYLQRREFLSQRAVKHPSG